MRIVNPASINVPLSRIRVVREWATTSGEGDNAKITIGMADGSVSQWPAQPWKYDSPSLTWNLGK